MIEAHTLLAGVTMIALTLYSLTGGADFGGGVWDLLATGPRASSQRRTISRAIGPIWEANHVWLIAVIVFTFVGFPRAFAAITTALHVPLTLMLLGVVLRGTAFVFRTYDSRRDEVQRRWSRVFAISSAATPVFLGLALGAVASGALRLDPATGRVRTDFVSEWLAPFPAAVAGLTVCLWAFLAAVYLTLDAETDELKEDFRARALVSGVATGALAFATLAAARSGAPLIYDGLVNRWWSAPFHGLTALLAVAALGCLWTRRYPLARAFAVAQAAFVLWGWAWSQFPYAVPPDLTFAEAAAPDVVLWPVLGALVGGSALLIPAFGWLFLLFKSGPVPGGPSPEALREAGAVPPEALREAEAVPLDALRELGVSPPPERTPPAPR